MSEEALRQEIARLTERVATLGQQLEEQERVARERSALLDRAEREARERAEQLARAEEELRRQAGIFKLVLDSMADGVAVVDDKGELLMRNPAAERMLGRAPLNLAASDGPEPADATLFFPDQATPWPMSEHPLARALRGETVDQIELFARKPAEPDAIVLRRGAGVSGAGAPTLAPASGAQADDAEPRSVRMPAVFAEPRVEQGPPPGLFLTVSASPMRGKDGTISGAVAVFRDATEKKRLIEDLEAKNRDLVESESAKSELVERLRYAIDEISTPILELWDDVLALPIIGVVDSRRSAQIMERLLDEIVRRQSRYVIIDVTGVEVIDTRTADHFMKLMKAVELLGARCRITGVRPAVAQTMVELGIDLGAVRAARNLKHALRESLALAGQKPTLSSLIGRRGAANGREQPAGHPFTPGGPEAAFDPSGSGPMTKNQLQLSARKETST
ncbi:positive regulator of sigma-B activity [Sorangium cellulosum]|uniref:Positive regulator of sigma-B activity n=1 Tax=Sorangium cellulosum TaxID=56 RepID=A0A4P2Q0N2_SORCE|nr:STAS domain-containing protein [Sorangium cellulosum]AUX22777.1 positive regulator of sigma-B activity [Sorangium cellulosum]